ncbi:peptidylprolyl isomerase [Brevundimonas sp.]|uniref:peptidylprolyl isomerase n=1 Tax=Brevundimonas sp. TaxID=1871086 RepID=UPI0025F7F096|nr:peptidylprolyl isomerase [Brevundimonas sp.]
MLRLLITTLVGLALSAPAVAQETVPPPPPPPDEGAVIAATDWREVPAENLLVIDTSRGRILVEMTPQAAPNHVERIRRLAREGFYDGQRFHRVIDWFMAQTGDPLSRGADRTLWGEGQSAYPDLEAEFTFRRGPEVGYAPVAQPAGAVIGFLGSLPIQTQPDALMSQTSDGRVHAWGLYCPGVAGMARGDENNSANSQFFLMRQAYPALDKRYTVWGRVVTGLDVVRSLQYGTDPSGAVPEPDVMTQVRVASDIADGDRPRVRVLAPESEAFAALVARVRGERGADFSICDIDLPAETF